MPATAHFPHRSSPATAPYLFITIDGETRPLNSERLKSVLLRTLGAARLEPAATWEAFASGIGLTADGLPICNADYWLSASGRWIAVVQTTEFEIQLYYGHAFNAHSLNHTHIDVARDAARLLRRLPGAVWRPSHIARTVRIRAVPMVENTDSGITGAPRQPFLRTLTDKENMVSILAICTTVFGSLFQNGPPDADELALPLLVGLAVIIIFTTIRHLLISPRFDWSAEKLKD